ncbi:hypothetical protein K151_1906 [Proteus hauseri ZMd44]|nr:hypothetical protein K151_1906 [Proteus hauseri ZMd44]
MLMFFLKINNELYRKYPIDSVPLMSLNDEFVKPCKSDRSVIVLCQYFLFYNWEIIMSTMKTEVIVIRLTKKERALLDSIKTAPLLADWMKELALSKLQEQEIPSNK